MTSLLLILIGTVLVNTFLLTQAEARTDADHDLGTIANAIRIAGATLITLVLSVIATIFLSLGLVAWLLSAHLRDILYFIYAVVVVSTAVVLHRMTRDRFPKLRRSLASSPVLIVSNCLALSTGLMAGDFFALSGANVIRDVLIATLAVGIGFGGLFVMFAALNERITKRQVPEIFRQAPITLISAGLVALALMGFTGLWRG